MSKVHKRAALYLRVSTDGQTTENQRRELVAVAAHRGWTISETYEDAGVSGAKGRDKRPGLDRMLTDAKRARFDVVMAWKLDRLGRSLPNLIETTGSLKDAHVDLYLHDQDIDTTTSMGRFFFHVMGAVAEFERDLIRDRVIAGIKRYRDKPNPPPFGRPKISIETEAAIRAHLAAGAGILKAARLVGVGSSTVQRVKREMQAGAAA